MSKTYSYKFLLVTFLFFFTITIIGQDAPVLSPKVYQSVYFGKSKPIREMPVVVGGPIGDNSKQESIPNIKDELPWDKTDLREHERLNNSNIQTEEGNRSAGGPLLNFAGNDNISGVYPPDPNGDMGLNYYIQNINRVFSVYNRDGDLVYGPVDNSSLWAGFDGPWDNVSWGGDPVFLYDHLADRWVMSAFSINHDQGLFYEMIAVSVTSDPLGEYYTYAFQFSEMNDYPKLAIWPDGYYLTYKMNGWETTETVVNRNAMLAGEEQVDMVVFQDGIGSYSNNPLSANLEGVSFDDGTPNYVILPVTNTSPPWFGIYIYEFQVNWDDPESSTFELVSQLEADPVSFNFPDGVVQPENFNLIDALFIRFMYPCSYRKYTDYESMVACQTLWTDDQTHCVRWYEMRKETEGDWYLHQQSSYSPDSVERWMGSINMNVNGDIAMGYSASGEATYPSIRYTGRLADDDPGEMTFQEVEAFKGLNIANNVSGDRNRWGDYSSMSVDPIDDSTFWYTSMYPTSSSGTGNWATRVISFNLNENGAPTTVNAGPADTVTCLYPLIVIEGVAENYTSAYWSTEGDGDLFSIYELDNIYYYGPGDIANGQVTLSLHALGYQPGEEVVDSMIVYINQDAQSMAGEDDIICKDESYTLSGQVMFSYVYQWSSLGDGMFSDSSLLNSIYTPGPADIENGEVALILTANNVEPCDGGTADTLILTIDECTQISELANQKLLVSISPNPTTNLLNVKIENKFEEGFQIELLNTSGKAIFTDKYKYSGNSYQHQLDLKYAPKGIYFLRIYNSKIKKTIKVIRL